MLDKIKSAVDITQRAQRNYDLSKSMPQEHLETLIYAASNSPSKQNETHYRLHVYTDKEIIEQVHNSTKKFTLGIYQALEEGKGEEWLYKNRSVTNSQIYANVLFIYEEIRGAPRGATHLRAQAGDKKSKEYAAEQRYYSIGISIGELILSASLLGYKTGICSAMDDDAIKRLTGIENDVKVLVGIGYPNEGVDRRLHPTVLNRDIPEDRHTGELDENWRFPSFDKKLQVYLNNEVHNAQ